MTVFKCKMCGGSLNISVDATVCECEFCGTQQTLPRLDNVKKNMLFDRANYYRSKNEFDKAFSVYETIIEENPDEAEAYWGLCLCRYGIEYVHDPKTNKFIPTCHRTQFKSILEDTDFLDVLKYADSIAKPVYLAEAVYIDTIQKQILEISGKENPFDIFICYKETDEYGRRTIDSVIAQDIYNELTKIGYNVFFSRITLKDKIGQAYEPYIFAALNSAKIMLVVGSKRDYFDAVWVKNEWGRYLSMIENGASKTLIPCYRDISPYDMPEVFAHLQAQDVSQVGYMQDLLRGIENILGTDGISHVDNTPLDTDNLLKRVFQFIEDEKWESADAYCEKILDHDVENARVYLAKIMIELKISTKADLKTNKIFIHENPNYRKALRYGDDKFHQQMETYAKYAKYNYAYSILHEENEEDLSFDKLQRREERLLECVQLLQELVPFLDSQEKLVHSEAMLMECRFEMAQDMLFHAETIENYKNAQKQFERIPEHPGSVEKIKVCEERIQELLEQAYQSAESLRIVCDDENQFRTIAEHFKELGDFRDSKEKYAFCMSKADELQQNHENFTKKLQLLQMKYSSLLSEEHPLFQKRELLQGRIATLQNIKNYKKGLTLWLFLAFNIIVKFFVNIDDIVQKHFRNDSFHFQYWVFLLLGFSLLISAILYFKLIGMLSKELDDDLTIGCGTLFFSPCTLD